MSLFVLSTKRPSTTIGPSNKYIFRVGVGDILILCKVIFVGKQLFSGVTEVT
jgi:hypothetical protein